MRKPFAAIAVDSHGFVIQTSDATSESVAWKDVMQVVVYKEDLLTVDRVWFRFALTAPVGSVEVHEEMPGFAALESAMPDRLPGFDRNWRAKVIRPAFAPNETVVFRRS